MRQPLCHDNDLDVLALGCLKFNGLVRQRRYFDALWCDWNVVSERHLLLRRTDRREQERSRHEPAQPLASSTDRWISHRQPPEGKQERDEREKPLSIAPLQFFWSGVRGGHQQTFNLCTVTSVSGILPPLSKKALPGGEAWMDLRTVACSLSALLALTLSAASPAGQQFQRIDDAALKNAGADAATTGSPTASIRRETRYSPLKQIDATNVAPARAARGPSTSDRGGGGQEATPLVCERRHLRHHQLERRRSPSTRAPGKELWRWDPEVNQAAVRPEICCGVVNRGLAIYQGHDHRADHRRPACRRSTRTPARSCGKRASRIRRTTTR